MKMGLLAAAAASTLFATAAAADTVYNTSLQNVNGSSGGNTATTTTDATGTRTTVTGTGTTRFSGSNTLNTWFQANVGPGSTVGITTDYARSGNGSAYFNSTQGANGKGDLIYYFGTNGSSSPVALSSLSSVSFDFYRDVRSTTDANLAPVLRFDMLKDGAFAGSLVFENVYQQQMAAPVNSWTTLTASLSSGIWWATNAKLGPTFADANGGQKTLAQWIADNGTSTLSVYGVEIGIGSGWSNMFYGAVDNVNVNFAARTVSSNFEVAAATPAVPEPASWALMIAGFGLAGVAMRRRRTVAPSLA